MKSLITTLLIIMTTALCSCGHADAEDTLRQAENDLRTGNISQAVTSCDLLTDTVGCSLSSTQMCRVAIIYAKVSEIKDDQNYMASATRCFEKAVTLDNKTDSLDRYIEALDVEDQCVVRVIREVSNAMNTTYDLSIDVNDVDEEYTTSQETEYHDIQPGNPTASL